MANGVVMDRPDEDVVIDSEFVGSIRCRNLLVEKSGSVTGKVFVSDTFKLAGSFDGSADAETFKSIPGARGRGSLFALNIQLRSPDIRMLIDTSRPSLVESLDADTPIVSDVAEDTGLSDVEDVVERRLAEVRSGRSDETGMHALDALARAAGLTAAPVPEAPSTSGDGLASRLAAIGVVLPERLDEDVIVTEAPPVVNFASRTPFLPLV